MPPNTGAACVPAVPHLTTVSDSQDFAVTSQTSAVHTSSMKVQRSLLLLLLGTSLFLIVTANYTYLQRFWVAAGDMSQAQWDRFLDYFGDDEWTIWFTCTQVFLGSMYWIVGGAFMLLDVTNKPAVLRRYKVQPGTNEPVDSDKLKNALVQILFNQFVVSGPYVFLVIQLVVPWRGMAPIRELPSLGQVLVHLACLLVLYEFSFYYSHRLLHHPFLFKHIHRKHHEWTSPIAVVAIYCHPVEHVVSNLTPLLLGVVLLGCHVVTAWIWFTYIVVGTLTVHSGYHLPFFLSPQAHDFHHFKSTQFYGSLGFLDRLHGTDNIFRETKAHTRHLVLSSLSSAREIFPDD